MISKNTWVVVRREVKVNLSKAFVFSTIFIPIIMAVIVGVQIALSKLETDSESNITIVTEKDNQFQHLLKDAFDQTEFVQNGLFKMTYKQLDLKDFDAFLEAEKTALLADDYRSIFVIPNAAAANKEVKFYSANTANADVRIKVAAAIDKAMNLRFFEVNNMANIDIKFIQSDVNISGIKVTKSGTETESWGPVIVGFTLAMLLLLGVMFNSVPIMSVVANEKATRVYEVLLSSLKPKDILWGKVIGTVITSTLQMLIWVTAFIILVLLMENFVDTSSFHMDFKPELIIFYLMNYVTGLSLFLTLYAGLSAAYDDASDASTALWPLYFVILLPFYTIFSLVSNPANSVATILSLAPITSFYVMPARMALIDVPLWQPAIALALNIGLVYMAVVAAGKMYRMSVLSTGNSPSLRQIFFMLKNA